MINTYKPEGMISSSAKNREYLYGGRVMLERAMLDGAILESTALLCDGDMNLHVDLHGITGIMPREEVVYCRDGEEIKDIAIITRVGKPICFKILSIEEVNGRTVAYLSRRQAQIECMNNYVSDLIPGDIIVSRVTHLEGFGYILALCQMLTDVADIGVCHLGDMYHAGLILLQGDERAEISDCFYFSL